MTFEYDIAKSEANKTKHGVNFEEAKQVWEDEDIVLLDSPFIEECRKLAIGRLYNKIWTVLFTTRNNKIRIISARRSRESEVAYYEKHRKN